MTYPKLRVALIVAITFLAINCVLATSAQIAASLFPYDLPEIVYAHAVEIDGALTMSFIVTAIAFAIWLYQAGLVANELSAEEPEFSPMWRIIWFFIPIACLWKPYQGMRELWNISQNRHLYESAQLVTLWWALWLGGGIVGSIYAANEYHTVIGFVCAVQEVASAAVCIYLLRQITAGLTGDRIAELDEIFA